MVFCGLLAGVLMVLSMLLCVTFNVGMRGVWVCCSGSAGREISKEEGVISL